MSRENVEKISELLPIKLCQPRLRILYLGDAGNKKRNPFELLPVVVEKRIRSRKKKNV